MPTKFLVDARAQFGDDVKRLVAAESYFALREKLKYVWE